MSIKSILLGLQRKYRDYVDPLYFQMIYAKRTLAKKRNTIQFDKIDSESILKIKELWGGVNGWFDFYYTIGDKSKAELYFPDDWFFKSIDAKLNDWRTCKTVDDKSMYDLYFFDVNKPRTIARCCNGLWLNDKYEITNLESVFASCHALGKVIIKPSIGSMGGRGILFWQKGQGDLNEKLNSCRNCVVQEIIEQHDDLSSIHSESINTIRILTMLYDDEVHILSSILRMGVGGSKVDNVSSGGIACGIDEQGRLKNKAFQADGRCYDKHPQGKILEGILIPGFESCKAICQKVAPRFSRFSRLISWDFAIDKNAQPVLIEANLYAGELDFHQMCNGPIFRDEATTKMMIDRYYKK